MTSEPVVGVVFGRPVVGKTILSYICLPFHSPTQASQLTETSSYYRFRCHYPLITYLNLDKKTKKYKLKRLRAAMSIIKIKQKSKKLRDKRKIGRLIWPLNYKFLWTKINKLKNMYLVIFSGKKYLWWSH